MAFDVITPTKLCVGAISATPTIDTKYTVPSSTRTMIKTIDIVNTTTSTITLRLYLVPSGDSPGTTNALFYDYSIPGNANLQWSGAQVIDAGDTIQTSASASGLTIHISGGVCQ